MLRSVQAINRILIDDNLCNSLLIFVSTQAQWILQRRDDFKCMEWGCWPLMWNDPQPRSSCPFFSSAFLHVCTFMPRAKEGWKARISQSTNNWVSSASSLLKIHFLIFDLKQFLTRDSFIFSYTALAFPFLFYFRSIMALKTAIP